MDNMNKITLTKDGHKALRDELQNLILNVRPKVIEELKEARAQGDLSENADYDSAKNKQAEVEARIVQLDHILENATILDSKENNKSTLVKIGSFVKLQYLDTKEIIELQILSPIEADPTGNPIKISSQSPLAKSILEKQVNDQVEVLGVAKPYKVKILDINYKK